MQNNQARVFGGRPLFFGTPPNEYFIPFRLFNSLVNNIEIIIIINPIIRGKQILSFGRISLVGGYLTLVLECPRPTASTFLNCKKFPGGGKIDFRETNGHQTVGLLNTRLII